MAGQQEIDIRFIVLGTMGMLMLALALVAFVVLYQKKRIKQQALLAQKEFWFQRDLMNAILETKETEQKRIAVELHDDIGSRLTYLKMKLGKTNFSQADIDHLNSQLQDIVQQVRAISHALLPPVLTEFGLPGAIAKLCAETEQNTSVKTVFRSHTFNPEGLSKPEELVVFRILQELLNNIIKYSGCTAIVVSLNSTAEFQILLEISDDGAGFVPPAELNFESKSMGLKNLTARSQQLGAKLEYTLNPNKGTHVSLKRIWQKKLYALQ